MDKPILTKEQILSFVNSQLKDGWHGEIRIVSDGKAVKVDMTNKFIADYQLKKYMDVNNNIL